MSTRLSIARSRAILRLVEVIEAKLFLELLMGLFVNTADLDRTC